MILNPPLTFKSAQVTSIDEKAHVIHFTVHVAGTVETLASPEFGEIIHREVSLACVYLEKEGFIQKPIEQWLTNVAAVLHNPNK